MQCYVTYDSARAFAVHSICLVDQSSVAFGGFFALRAEYRQCNCCGQHVWGLYCTWQLDLWEWTQHTKHDVRECQATPGNIALLRWFLFLCDRRLAVANFVLLQQAMHVR